MVREIDLQKGEHDDICRFPSLRRTTAQTLERRRLYGREVVIIDGQSEEHVRLNGRRLFTVSYYNNAIAEP